MQTMGINSTPIYYATYVSSVDTVDSSGYKTGEKTTTYSAPIYTRMVMSAGQGTIATQPFGSDLDYSYTLLTHDMNCAMDENSILWVNELTTNPFNFRVVGVYKSLNHIRYAIKEVRK